MKFLLISLFLHLFVFLWLKWPHKEQNSTPKSPKVALHEQVIRLRVIKMSETESVLRAEVKSTPEPSKLANVAKKKHELPIAVKNKKTQSKKCKKFYYGIGYTGSLLPDDKNKCDISNIAKDGPLYRAGAKVGDTVESVDSMWCPGRGAEGTTVTVIIHNSKGSSTLTLKREKICED